VLPSEALKPATDVGGRWEELIRSNPQYHPFEAAAEVALAEYFQSGHVLFHAYDAGYLPGARIQYWANLWKAPFFDTTSSLKDFLRHQRE
jgi:hypothetical protein